MNTSNRHRKEQISLFAVFQYGCAFALSIGAIDLTVAMLRLPRVDFSSFVFMFPPLAATTLAAAIAYVFFAVFIMGALKAAGKDVFLIAPALLVFVAAAFAFAALLDLVPLSVVNPLISKGDYLLKSGFVVVLSVFVSVGAHFTALRFREGPRGASIFSSIAGAIPLILGEGMVLVWLEKYWVASFTSPASLAATVIILSAVVVTVAAFYFWGHRPLLKAIPIGLFLAVSLSPAATLSRIPNRQTSPARATRADHEIPRIYLIVIDTLRPDFLSCYDPDAPSTPHIDALARDGVLFQNAISPGPWTVPAMGSIMTGFYPLTHGMTKFGARIPKELKTLGEYMDEAGYTTGGIGDNGNLRAHAGFNRGFHSYMWFPQFEFLNNSLGASLLNRLFPRSYRDNASTPYLVDLSLRWVDDHENEDTFLWLHLYDPHMPYEPPVQYRPPGLPPPGLTYAFSKNEVSKALSGKGAQTRPEREWVEALYGGEVHHVDDEIGRFIDGLRDRGLYDDALIILTSDHGEEFWEHGDYEHGQSLYGELVHVPLIIKPPGSKAGDVVSTTVSTVSLLPTLLDMVGLGYDGEQFAGPSLAALTVTDGAAYIPRPAASSGLMRGDERHSLRFNGFSFIQSIVNGNEELYDLQEDPRETANLARDDPAATTRGRALLDKVRRRAKAFASVFGVDNDAETVLDAETADILESMGYLE